MQKFTVNGVSYDSLESMPPDVRQLYDQAAASVPGLEDRNGDGIPDIVQGAGPIQLGTRITSKLIVNGREYASVKDLPPELRAAYEKAMGTLAAGGPNVKQNVISVQVAKPRLTLSLNTSMHRSGAPGAVTTVNAPPPGSLPTPTPIEPGSMEGGLRGLLVMVALAVGGLAVWMLVRGHH